MTSPRETIYNALFAMLKGVPNVQQCSRRFIPFARLNAGNTPIIQQVEKAESRVESKDPRMPYYWRIEVEIVIYVGSPPDDNFIPATPLNNIIDYIEQKIPQSLPQNQGPAGLYPSGVLRQTLGVPGVQAVQIVGSIVKDEGVVAPDVYAVIPIEIQSL
jgi:hypothetical protein